MSTKQPTLFEDRFIESFVGQIMDSQTIAIVELVANAWDAGATNVDIRWPEAEGEEFYIEDNGHGMTEKEFNSRFVTLGYNREKHQGKFAEIPEENKAIIPKRSAFGRNGKGRLGGLAFGEPFFVVTRKNGLENTFKVARDNTNNLISFVKVGEPIPKEGHGTKVLVKNSVSPTLNDEEARTEIGMRFLTDPNFVVKINDVVVSFNDIPEECLFEKKVSIPEVGEILMQVIDVHQTDRTTQQHGIAWHVKNRLVGECSWKGSGSEHLLDGRRIAAKRYIFILHADCLENAVVPDWTTFIPSDPKWVAASEVMYEEIKNYLLDLTKGQREEVFKEVENSNKSEIRKLGIVPREKWEKFIKSVQEDCPSISTADLVKLGALLANLENTDSKFSLLHILANSSYDELDNLTEILLKWDIDYVKIVLDEIEFRTKLLEKLQSKVLSTLTDEVQELQPLFHRGLWIFGPEYETIEFTSNQGMTSVIQKLFGKDETGSRKRPDFAILADSTVGLYGLPKYDEAGGEVGIDRLTIVELKKPGVSLGQEEVNQSWKYVNELLKKGLLKKESKVMCFVLGSALVPFESERTTKMDGNVVIQPLDYDTVIRRAKSRLLNLYDKIKNVRFLEDDRIREYMREKSEMELF